MTILTFSLGNWSSSGNFSVNPKYPVIPPGWKTLRCCRIQVLILHHSVISALRKNFCFQQNGLFNFLKSCHVVCYEPRFVCGISMVWMVLYWCFSCNTDHFSALLYTCLYIVLRSLTKMEALVFIVFCAVFLIAWMLSFLCHRCSYSASKCSWFMGTRSSVFLFSLSM